MLHCRSLVRARGQLAKRVALLPGRGQIRWQSQQETLWQQKSPRIRKTRPQRTPPPPPTPTISQLLPKDKNDIGACSVAEVASDAITLRFVGDSGPIKLSTLWLRDSCQCEACVSSSSGQKRFATFQIPKDLGVENASVSEDGSLRVTWQNDIPDGSASPSSHSSTYTRDFLLDRLMNERTTLPDRHLWNADALKERLGFHEFAQYMEDGPAFSQAIGDFWRDGIIIVTGVPDTEIAVENLAQRFGNIQETIYGRTWDVRSKPDAENIAYTNEYLAPHQDLLYWSDIPAVQILHCLHNDCDGGESLFTDSWLAMFHFRLTHSQEAINSLGLQVPYVYNKGGHSLGRTHPVFGPKGQMPVVRWCPPFQGVFDVSKIGADGNALKKWHEAAAIFGQHVESKERMFELKLQPGQAVIFDNSRILHGRKQFNSSQGSRWLKGTYVNMSNMRSKMLQILGTKTCDDTPTNYEAQAREILVAEGIEVPIEGESSGQDAQSGRPLPSF